MKYNEAQMSPVTWTPAKENPAFLQEATQRDGVDEL